MPKDPSNLGKLLAVHATAPVHIQRAAIVAILSFLFFGGMLVAFLVRQHFLYLILATAFFVVNIFTLIGFMMQRRNAVRIFERGLSYGKTKVDWSSVSSFVSGDGELVIKNENGDKLLIPKTIDRYDQLAQLIEQKTAR